MSTSPSSDYDRFPYPSFAHAQTFAENLALKGLLRGMEVAPPDRCRVLELGCGDGFNLAAMATVHPESTYVGIDYASDTVERGKRMLADIGMTQVRLEQGDIRSLRVDLGEFDYIIAHGVYSWVPYEVRDALLATLQRHLAPNGVGFVSYLALPGALQRELARTIMRFHVRSINDPVEKVQQSKAALQMMLHAPTEDNLYTRLLEGEWRSISSRHDSGLFHDELSDVSAPLLFTEFIDHAQRHSLTFLSEAEYLFPLGRLKDDARNFLRPLEHNRVLLEQYIDFIEGRRFRQTLLCRPGQGQQLAPHSLDKLFLRFSAKPVQESAVVNGPEDLEFRGLKNAMLRAKSPVEKATLIELSSWGDAMRTYRELVPAVIARLAAVGIASDETMEMAMRRFIMQSSVAGLIELAWKKNRAARKIPERPRTAALTRWQLAKGDGMVVNLSGHLVEINGELGRFLLSLLDGTRDRTAMLTDIRAFLRAAAATPPPNGESAKLPSPDNPDLERQLTQSLQGLTELELFYAE